MRNQNIIQYIKAGAVIKEIENKYFLIHHEKELCEVSISQMEFLTKRNFDFEYNRRLKTWYYKKDAIEYGNSDRYKFNKSPFAQNLKKLDDMEFDALYKCISMSDLLKTVIAQYRVFENKVNIQDKAIQKEYNKRKKYWRFSNENF